MQYVPRRIEPVLRRAALDFPAVILTGPRRSGKATVLRRVFPRASYVLLEDSDVLSRVKADPRGFLEGLKLPVVLDEIQNAPELLGFIRSFVEAKATRTVRPELARSLAALGAAAGGARPPAAFVVHRGPAAGVETTALRPGVKSVSLSGLLATLSRTARRL